MATTVWRGEDPHVYSKTIEVDEVGVSTITEVYSCRDEDMAKDCLDFAAEDCTLPVTRPRVESSAGDRVEGGMWQVTRNFVGILSEELVGDFRIYGCKTIANREPIQTHPNFKDFGGKAGAPVCGAVFDAIGNFERFKPYLTTGDFKLVNGVKTAVTTLEKNRKCGVTDYLCPIVHLTESRLILEEDLDSFIQGLGFIDDEPPDTSMRPDWPNRSWLLSKADPQWVGFQVYKLQREWSLSGPRGWDGDIYPK